MRALSVLSSLALLLPTSNILVQAAEMSTVVVSAPQATDLSYTDAAIFQQDLVAAHNFYRGQHGVKDLRWNDTSAAFAAQWAKACNFRHSGGPTGENLAAGYASASASVDAWGLERKHYSFRSPTGYSEKTAHFTQLVWSNTTSVGCGVASCQGRNATPGFYVVCEYYPPGNVVGAKKQYFKDNVLKQTSGKKTDAVATSVTSSGPGRRETRHLVGVIGVAAMAGFGIGV